MVGFRECLRLLPPAHIGGAQDGRAPPGSRAARRHLTRRASPPAHAGGSRVCVYFGCSRASGVSWRCLRRCPRFRVDGDQRRRAPPAYAGGSDHIGGAQDGRAPPGSRAARRHLSLGRDSEVERSDDVRCGKLTRRASPPAHAGGSRVCVYFGCSRASGVIPQCNAAPPLVRRSHPL